MTTEAIQIATQAYVAAIPYSIAFWVVGKIVNIFLGAAFGGRIKF